MPSLPRLQNQLGNGQARLSPLHANRRSALQHSLRVVALSADVPRVPRSRTVEIVKETERLLLVNKPPGMSFHADQEDEMGLVETLRSMQSSGDMEYKGEIHSVHRLDRVTSGLVAFAKDAEAGAMLSKAFQDRRVSKYYIALSTRKPGKAQGKIVGDMERSRRGTWKLIRSTENPAVTHFRSWGVPGRQQGLRLYILKPQTGKTHQLRVAMKSNSVPILGDPLYSAAEDAQQMDRCYLHATALRLPLLESDCCAGGTSLMGDNSSMSESFPGTLDVVLPPGEGLEFCSPEFQDAFKTHFMTGVSAEKATWFADTKVLSSYSG